MLGAGTAFSGEPSSDLDRVMGQLRAVTAASGQFVERKQVKLLTRPLQSSGVLHYAAPDRLEKITEKPARETMLLRGGILSGTRSNGDRYHLSLDDHPDVAALVEGIRSTLAGDLPTLRRYYDIAFTESGAGWELHLSPKSDAVRSKVVEIRIDGVGAALSQVDVIEADGDHSEMTITPVSP